MTLDTVGSVYDRHPYPAPVADLDAYRRRGHSVPQLFELVHGAGLTFGRWLKRALTPADRYAAVELFRGTMVRQSAIVHHGATAIDFAEDADAKRTLGAIARWAGSCDEIVRAFFERPWSWDQVVFDASGSP